MALVCFNDEKSSVAYMDTPRAIHDSLAASRRVA
jgi:hypothetical protein